MRPKEESMKHEQQVVLKRWIPILEEYEKTKAKQVPRVFKSIKALCEATISPPKNSGDSTGDGSNPTPFMFEEMGRKPGGPPNQTRTDR
jgi:hypothetical protein